MVLVGKAAGKDVWMSFGQSAATGLILVGGFTACGPCVSVPTHGTLSQAAALVASHSAAPLAALQHQHKSQVHASSAHGHRPPARTGMDPSRPNRTDRMARYRGSPKGARGDRPGYEYTRGGSMSPDSYDRGDSMRPIPRQDIRMSRCWGRSSCAPLLRAPPTKPTTARRLPVARASPTPRHSLAPARPLPPLPLHYTASISSSPIVPSHPSPPNLPCTPHQDRPRPRGTCHLLNPSLLHS
ncbi:hypothetical protein B0H10DRAFT_2375415 [Mycena sp. CBHHK59/15]|nr:hypothetical protein B0H10DRAFT_2375415 [Mycena sp. CBHHK59/15]